MASIGDTTRPEYIYDQATDTWIPVGIGPHSHTPAAIGAISSSVVTTKGDLIAGTGSGTVVRQGVGADGTFLMADSTQADGLNYAGPLFTAGRNRIINGDFRFNQRNFTSATTYGTYGFDRFYLEAVGGTFTYSAQTFTPGTAPVSGYEAINYARLVTASQSTNTNYAAINQKIEDVRTFAGQTITVSFWATASTGTPNIGITFEQNFGTGGSAPVPTSAAVKTITSSWARYSFTVNIPSISGKTIGTSPFLNLYLFTSVGTSVSSAGFAAVGLQNVTIDFWGVQVEAGSVATPFTTATGTIQGELAACQRYYQRLDAANNAAQMVIGPAWAFNANGADLVYKLTTEMRVAPTVLDYSSLSHFQWQGITVNSIPTSIVYDTNINSRYNAGVTFNKTAGYTSGGNYFILVNTSSAYIGFGAEL